MFLDSILKPKNTDTNNEVEAGDLENLEAKDEYWFWRVADHYAWFVQGDDVYVTDTANIADVGDFTAPIKIPGTENIWKADGYRVYTVVESENGMYILRDSDGKKYIVDQSLASFIDENQRQYPKGNGAIVHDSDLQPFFKEQN